MQSACEIYFAGGITFKCAKSCLYVATGDPQGSYIGTVMFPLFLNDLKDCINCLEFLEYDDVKIFSSINYRYKILP